MSSQFRRRRAAPWAKRLSLMVICVGVTALLLELGARTYFHWRHGFSFSESFLYVADPLLDYRLNPHYQAVGPADGRRLPENAVRSAGQERVIRIVALGGSITWGHHNRGAHTWPAQLEEFLNRSHQLGRVPVEVINAGTPGYGSRQLLLRFTRELADLQPTLVIVGATWNGVGSVSDPRAWCPENVAGRHARFGRWLNAWLMQHSLLVARFHLVAPNAQFTVPTLEPVAELFREDLRELIRQARERQIALVLLQAPSLWRRQEADETPGAAGTSRPEPESYLAVARANQQLARSIVEQVAREFHVPVIDAETPFHALPLVEQADFFTDYMHLSDAGNVRLAALISGELLPQLARIVQEQPHTSWSAQEVDVRVLRGL